MADPGPAVLQLVEDDSELGMALGSHCRANRLIVNQLLIENEAIERLAFKKICLKTINNRLL